LTKFKFQFQVVLLLLWDLQRESSRLTWSIYWKFESWGG